jgi:WD40 repeat protein
MVDLDGQGAVLKLPPTLTHSAFSPDGSILAGTWGEMIQEIYPIGSTSPRPARSAAGAGDGKNYLVPGGKLLLRKEQRTLKEGGVATAYQVVEVDSGKTVSQLLLKGEVQPFAGAMLARCSPDGKYLALPSWGSAASLRVWHMPSGKLIFRLPGQNNVVFAPEGRIAVAYSLAFFDPNREKLAVTFFDLETGRKVGTVAAAVVPRWPFPATGEPFAFSRDGSAFAFLRDRDIVLWDVKKKAEAGSLEGHATRVTGLLVPAGGGLISVDDGGTWKRWDLEARKEVATGRQEDGRVARLALSPDGKHMASAGGTGIHLWDTTTGQRLRTIRDDRAAGGELEFVAGGRRLMAWGSRRLWDLATGKEPGTYRNSPPRPFLSVAYTSDGRSLLAVTAPPVQNGPPGGATWPEVPEEVRSLASLSLPPGAAATVHDAATGKQRFRIPPRDVPSVFTADGRFLVGPLIAAEIDAPVNAVYWFPQNILVSELVVTEAATGKAVLRIPCPPGGGQVWLPGDGKTLALAIPGRPLQLWDLDTRRVRGSIPAQRVWNVRVSPAGNVLASFGELTELWDVATGKPWAPLAEVPGFPVGFTADGKLLATNIPRPGGSEIALWDLLAGRKLSPPQGRGPVLVRGVVISNGHAVLLHPARPQDRLALWEFQGRRVAQELPVGLSVIPDFPPSFSLDGSMVVLSGTSGTDPRAQPPFACIVQTDSGKAALDLSANLPVCFLSGGQTLLVGRLGSPTGTVRLIETGTGRVLQTFPGVLQVPQWSSRWLPPQPSMDPRTCPAPDGQTLMHTMGGVVQIYDALTGRLRATFQGEAERLPIQGVSADGKTLAVKTLERRPGSSPGSVIHVPVLRLWDADTGKERPGPRGPFDTLDIGPDRRTLHVQRAVRHLTLWDAGTCKELSSRAGIAGWLTELAWSPDGRSVVTVSQVPDPNRLFPNNGVTQIWHAASGKELCRFDCDQGTAAFSPDGRLVAITTTTGTAREKRVQIWEADGGRLRHTFAGAQRGLFAEGGRTFVTAGLTGLTVWDLGSGAPRHKLLAGEDVADMQVTVDGKSLLTLSSQSTADGAS